MNDARTWPGRAWSTCRPRAREVIQATRSLLDAAEELVDDPSAVQSLVGTIASVAQAAASRLRGDPARRRHPTGMTTTAAVQRIRVS